MAVTQYIGSRYVPLFADPIEWSSQNTYEPLTIVIHEGNSYTSRQAVPKGIAIDNGDFWALTGNHNAQVELYRRETAEAKSAADDAQETADAVQTDIDTLLPKADYSADSTVTDAINAAKQDAEQTAQDYTDGKASDIMGIIGSGFSDDDTVSQFAYTQNVFDKKSLETKFVGRYIPDAATPVVQAMCVHDNYGFFAASNSSSTDDATIYKVNLYNGNIISKTSVQLGHANSLAFDEFLNKVLVAPSEYYAPARASRDVIICNGNTLAIESTKTFGFNVGAVAYDKITNKRYVASPISNGYTLYEIDANYDTVNSVTLNCNVFYVAPNVATYYVNDMCVNDGKAYVSVGAEDFQKILIFDVASGEFLNTISVDSQQFIYTNRELQSIDFTPYGDIIGVGMAVCRLKQENMGSIFAIDYSGRISAYNSSPVGRNVAHVNPATSETSIFVNGDSYPFHDCMEALQAVGMGFARSIRLDADAEFNPYSTTGYNTANVHFDLGNHVLYASGTVRGGFFSFEGGTIKSLSSGTLVIYNARVVMHNVVISGDGAGTYLPLNLARCYIIITDGCSVADNPSDKSLPASASILYTRLDINYGNYYYAKYLTKVN